MTICERECLGSKLSARAAFVGGDLWVLVSGGENPHIGSVSVGIPRKSLTGDGGDSATVSTFNVTGHKDDVVGNLFAARLASEFRCTVSVSCGIHYHALSRDALCHIMDEVEFLLADLVVSLR
ncbi:MAG: hypothetical protein LBR94_04980 [Desulfovibrio sp.]|jgi:hypothetical protein|nr:hypothetical protein [Desulfovibrio sp.]